MDALLRILIALLPVIILSCGWEVDFFPFVAGISSWIVAILIKSPCDILITKILKKRNASNSIIALISGSLSALTELGATAFLFVQYEELKKLTNLIAVGVGISSVEVALGFAVYFFQKIIQRIDNSEQLVVSELKFSGSIERFGALLGHVSSRGLIYFGLFYSPVWGMIGFLLFTIVDGLASYGFLEEWNWASKKTLKRFYTIVTSVSIIEAIIFLSLILRFGYL